MKTRERDCAADGLYESGFWIECKCERLTNPRGALRQAAKGARGKAYQPVAVCKDNGKPPHVAMTFETFLDLLAELHALRGR